jgi:hypothetical protein
MGVRGEALDLLRDGLLPREIAEYQGVTLATILGYLDQLVGRGDLRRSDILFSVQKGRVRLVAKGYPRDNKKKLSATSRRRPGTCC